MYLAFSRQAILLAPLLLLGAWLKQLHLVWLSFAIAEVISIPFGILLYRRIGKNGKPQETEYEETGFRYEN